MTLSLAQNFARLHVAEKSHTAKVRHQIQAFDFTSEICFDRDSEAVAGTKCKALLTEVGRRNARFTLAVFLLVSQEKFSHYLNDTHRHSLMGNYSFLIYRLNKNTESH